MDLHDEFTYEGKHVGVTYCDADSFDNLPSGQVRQHYGVCFSGDKIVLCSHPNKADRWALPGGKPELNESFDETLAREVQEETNMRILRHQPLGYQIVTEDGCSPVIQLRSFCEVEPIGQFIADPAGAVMSIALVAPKEANALLGWGVIGDRIIERAMEIRGN